MTIRVRVIRVIRGRPDLRGISGPHNVQTFFAAMAYPKTDAGIWRLRTRCRDLEKMDENHNSLPIKHYGKHFFLSPLCKSDLAFPDNAPENAFTGQPVPELCRGRGVGLPQTARGYLKSTRLEPHAPRGQRGVPRQASGRGAGLQRRPCIAAYTAASSKQERRMLAPWQNDTPPTPP